MYPLTNERENAIIYKYNKYIQVNGTLFYAFEYFLQLLSVDPNMKFYILIPKKYQKDYLDKLYLMFKTKYPLLNRKKFLDKQLLDIVKENYSKEDYIELKNLVITVNKAFESIKLVTDLALLRPQSKSFNKVLCPCMNTWMSLVDIGFFKINKPNETFVFQNRNMNTLVLEEHHINSMINAKFFYECPDQKPRLSSSLLAANHLEQYSLKIGFNFILPKKYWKIFNKSDKIIAGKPIVNQRIEYEFNDNLKPSLFAMVRPGIFLNTKEIQYYQNFNRWEENTRIIPEARYFNIPLKVVSDHSLDINNLEVSNQNNLTPDSSVGRLVNDLEDYILGPEDRIIQLFR